MKNEVVLVTGTSGTGKTTVYRELKKLGIATIGIDEEPHLSCWVDGEGTAIVRDNIVFDEEFLANHQWVCDLDVLQKLIKESPKPVVVCGSSDNIRDVMKLCDTTLVLTCPSEIFLERIQKRTDNEYGKTQAAAQALLGYYEQYNNECIEAGAISIDASRPITDVIDDVRSYL